MAATQLTVCCYDRYIKTYKAVWQLLRIHNHPMNFRPQYVASRLFARWSTRDTVWLAYRYLALVGNVSKRPHLAKLMGLLGEVRPCT